MNKWLLILVLNGCLVGNPGYELAKSTGGGWSSSGGLVTGGGLENGFKCQADFQKSANGAGNYTIQFGITKQAFTGIPIDQIIIKPRAEITWSVEGNDVRRLVSVVNGLSVTGQSEAVSVRLFDAIRSTDPAPYVRGIPYRGNIQIARGNRPSVQQPPTLFPLDYINALGTVTPILTAITVATGTTIFVPVPFDAGVISVFVTAFANTTILNRGDVGVAQLTNIGAGSSLRSYFPIDYEWVDLVPGCTAIAITNNIVTPVDFSVIFGIDG